MKDSDHDIKMQETLQIALRYQQAGELTKAIDIYFSILEKQPANLDAIHLLGMVAYQAEKYDLALNLIERAIGIDPSIPDLHNSLGLILQAKNLVESAIISFKKAIEISPAFSKAYYNLGYILQQRNTLTEAAAYYRKAIELQPNYPQAYNNLGNILKSQSQATEAIICYKQAIQFQPSYSEAYYNLGLIFHKKNNLKEAILNYQKAIHLQPSYYEAIYNLGNAVFEQGKVDHAIEFFRKAIELKPNDPRALCSLGKVLYEKGGKIESAIKCYQRAIEVEPDFPDAYNNLGAALKDQGKVTEAISCFRKALELKPDFQIAYSNLLQSINYHHAYSPRSILKEHQRWAKQFTLSLKTLAKPHNNNLQPNRRLRIGYVSPDFRKHAVAYFMTPIFENHNKTDFEIYCYANHEQIDEITRYFQNLTNHWRFIAKLTDEQVASQIYTDQIDILVDLAGHSALNRILLFARKPAPIQLSYLGYPSTTGLSTMDYRITDIHADPPGMTEKNYIEELIRLPNCTWCYRPPAFSPEIPNLPALASDQITLASLNNFAKIGPDVIALWSKILKTLPKARLMLQVRGGDQVNQHVFELFSSHGITQTQLEIVDQMPQPEFLKLYQKIDVSLDPFPCNGGTTTCDSLWMGVPVVTLAGQTFVSRAGVTLLNNIGLKELIAETPEHYLQIVLNLAHNLSYLQQLRIELRQRMLNSSLMNAKSFTKNLEAAYRQVWQKWCREQNQ